MKKTYVMTVDYDEGAKGVCEVFGTSILEVSEFHMKIVTY